MKGAVFIALNDMIERDFGILTWEKLLQEVKPKSAGIYTSTKDYDDDEMTKFVIAISKHTGMSTADVTQTFGVSLFASLNERFPIFTSLNPSLFQLLLSIETVIHKEVRKLYENANLPTIRCEKITAVQMNLHYQSPRKLCVLAEGLIQGAAHHFNETIRLEHSTCTHNGDSECLLEVHKL